MFEVPLEGLADGSPLPLLVADLGAGGGVPSLPLALSIPELRFVLVDASQRRTSFLVWAAVELGVAERVEVCWARAEELGHDLNRRFRFDAVVARGFGPPGTTLECAAPLLREGGRCIVSEPPGGRRWPMGPLLDLGLEAVRIGHGVAVFERSGEVASRFPRRAKEQKRSPLFTL